MLAKGRLFVISAPTGGGKTTIASQVLALLAPKLRLEKVITYTTRLPRMHEQQGVDYHFVTKEMFKHLQKEQFFLETTTYDGNYYGSPRSIIDDMKQGKSFIMVADRLGANTIKQNYAAAVLVWFDVPTITILKKRLEQRGREKGEQLQQRLILAEQEIDAEAKNPIFDVHLLNDDLTAAVTALTQLIEGSLANSCR